MKRNGLNKWWQELLSRTEVSLVDLSRAFFRVIANCIVLSVILYIFHLHFSHVHLGFKMSLLCSMPNFKSIRSANIKIFGKKESMCVCVCMCPEFNIQRGKKKKTRIQCCLKTWTANNIVFSCYWINALCFSMLKIWSQEVGGGRPCQFCTLYANPQAFFGSGRQTEGKHCQLLLAKHFHHSEDRRARKCKRYQAKQWLNTVHGFYLVRLYKNVFYSCNHFKKSIYLSSCLQGAEREGATRGFLFCFVC